MIALSRSVLLVWACLLPTLAQAELWSASRVQGRPDPPHAFTTEQVLTQLPLQNVTDMVPVPGSAQWLIAENGGKIWSVAHDTTATEPTLAIDVKALHPACDQSRCRTCSTIGKIMLKFGRIL